jgi:tetratricopeptide (TPR) repeat protein
MIKMYVETEELLCKHLIIEYWKKEFQDKNLITIIESITKHPNKIEYLGIRGNEITEKGLFEIYELLLKSENKSLIFLEVDQELKETKIYHEINNFLQKRFMNDKLDIFQQNLKKLEKMFEDDDTNTTLIDKYNDLSYLYFNLGLNLLSENKEETNNEFFQNTIKYLEISKFIFEKRFGKKLSTYNQNIGTVYWYMNEKEKAFLYREKSYFHNKNINWIPFERINKPIKILCLDGGGVRGTFLPNVYRFKRVGHVGIYSK